MDLGRQCESGWLDENYIFLGEVGKGGQATVHLRMDSKAKRGIVAIKKLRPDVSEKMRINEFRILTQVLRWQPGIPKILDFLVESGLTYMIMEYYAGGTIDRLMTAYRENDDARLEQAFIWHAAANISSAVAYIHKHGVVHRDIKPMNIFLDWAREVSRDKEYPNLVLGDFGIAAEVNAEDYNPVCAWGTPAWQPPERPRNGPKADVWAVGAIIHALCHNGSPPIETPPPDVMRDRKALARWWEDPQKRQIKPVYLKYGQKMEGWLHVMLRFNPENRIDSADLAKELEYRAFKLVPKYFRPLREFIRDDLSLPNIEVTKGKEPTKHVRDQENHTRREGRAVTTQRKETRTKWTRRGYEEELRHTRDHEHDRAATQTSVHRSNQSNQRKRKSFSGRILAKVGL